LLLVEAAATTTAKATTTEGKKFKALIERNVEFESSETTAEATTEATTTPRTVYFLQFIHRQFKGVGGSDQVCLLNGIL